MKVGVLGTRTVGRSLAGKLAERGHDVVVGTRDPAATLARTTPDAMGNAPFSVWQRGHPAVKLGTLAKAAQHGELVINTTRGMGSLDALKAAGAANLRGKVLLDASTPLDFSQGMPPTLAVCNTDSLGEQIQRAFPEAQVVKSLNTVTANLMGNPQAVGGADHHVFVCGNDASAKDRVTALLRDDFGWRNIVDLGEIKAVRGAGMYLLTWVHLMGALKTPMFNVKLVR